MISSRLVTTEPTLLTTIPAAMLAISAACSTFNPEPIPAARTAASVLHSPAGRRIRLKHGFGSGGAVGVATTTMPEPTVLVESGSAPLLTAAGRAKRRYLMDNCDNIRPSDRAPTAETMIKATRQEQRRFRGNRAIVNSLRTCLV